MNKPKWCSCMAKQVETVEGQHACTEPRTLTGSTTYTTTFEAIYRRLREHGSFERLTWKEAADCAYTRCGGTGLHDIENNPGTSSRQVARQHIVRQRTVICILHDNLYYPYHLQRVQGLSPEDYRSRERFFCWFVTSAGIVTGGLSSTGKIL